MSDQESQPQPGWRPTEEEELFESTSPPTAQSQRPWADTPSSGQSQPSPSSSAGQDAIDLLRQRSSSPASSDALAGLLGEGLQLVAAVVTALTRSRFGLDLKMQPAEANAAAKPIARLVARRFQIRRDLAEATDATAAGASLMSYVERIAARTFTEPRVDRSVATAPRAVAQALADEADYRGYPPSPPTTPQPVPFVAPSAPVHDPSGDAVPGSGPVKSAFLEGFEE